MKQRANASQQEDETHLLFLLRVWVHDPGDGQKRWHGKVQNIVYGEAQHFKEWSALIDCLLSMLPSLDTEQPSLAEGDERC